MTNSFGENLSDRRFEMENFWSDECLSYVDNFMVIFSKRVSAPATYVCRRNIQRMLKNMSQIPEIPFGLIVSVEI